MQGILDYENWDTERLQRWYDFIAREREQYYADLYIEMRLHKSDAHLDYLRQQIAACDVDLTRMRSALDLTSGIENKASNNPEGSIYA